MTSALIRSEEETERRMPCEDPDTERERRPCQGVGRERLELCCHKPRNTWSIEAEEARKHHLLEASVELGPARTLILNF